MQFVTMVIRGSHLFRCFVIRPTVPLCFPETELFDAHSASIQDAWRWEHLINTIEILKGAHTTHFEYLYGILKVVVSSCVCLCVCLCLNTLGLDYLHFNMLSFGFLLSFVHWSINKSTIANIAPRKCLKNKSEKYLTTYFFENKQQWQEIMPS